MADPRWTTTVPSEAGYYWMRVTDEYAHFPPQRSFGEPILTQVRYTSRSGVMMVGNIGEMRWYEIPELPNVEWWPVPIAPPGS